MKESTTRLWRDKHSMGSLLGTEDVSALERGLQGLNDGQVAEGVALLWQAVGEGPTAERYIAAVRGLLNAECIRSAQEMAAEGLSRYPDNLDLQRLARLLAPPKIVDSPLQGYREPDRFREFTWLREHRHEYRGKWVAVLDDRLIAVADALPDLLEQVKQARLTEHPLVHLLG